MSGFRRAMAKFRGHDDFHMNIIGRKVVWFALSGLVIVASLGGLFVRHLNYSLEFKGGARLTYTVHTPVTADQVDAVLVKDGITDATVQLVAGTQISIHVKKLDPDKLTEIQTDLATQAGISTADINIQNVSPTWGSQISKKALQGLIIFLILVSIYISFRFEWKMAVGGLVALLHDLLITAGVYALVGREVTPETVIAILTILGYSLYDTVVIYDKIKENTENPALVAREGYSRVVNLSMNQVFMRSVNTSLVVLFPVGALLFFGGATLKDFAFALFVGVLAGTYSSIFVASPLLALLKEREPKYTQIRTRLEGRGPRPTARPRPAAVTAGAVRGDGEARQPAAVTTTVSARPAGGAPRPAGAGGGAKKRPAKKKPKRRRR